MAYAIGTLAPRRPVVAPLRTAGATGGPSHVSAPILMQPQLAVGNATAAGVSPGPALAAMSPAPAAASAPPAVPTPPVPIASAESSPVAQTMAPIAYAMDKYKETGNPLTAAALGFVYGKQAQQAQAEDDAKKAEASKLLDGHPDLQSAVKKGVLSLDTAVQMKTNRDNVTANTKISADRRASIDHYLRAAGDDDIADQFASGLLDEAGVSKAVAAKDGGGADFTLGKDETRFDAQGNVVATNAAPAGSADPANLPIVQVDEKGKPDPAQQQDFLSQLNPQDAALVKQITNYQAPVEKVTSLRGGERERISALAAQYDPTFDMTQYTARARARVAYTTGQQGQTITSANTVIGHLNNLAKDADKLGNSDWTAWNGLSNWAKKQSSNKELATFESDRTAVASELAKFFKGTGATDMTTTEEWLRQFDANTGSGATRAVVTNIISNLMKSRLDEMASQYHAIMGRPVDFAFLSPETVKVLTDDMHIDPSTLDPTIGGQLQSPAYPPPAAGAPPAAAGAGAAPATPAPAAAPAKEIDPGDKAGYDALPVGALYTVPGDPTVYTKRQQ